MACSPFALLGFLAGLSPLFLNETSHVPVATCRDMCDVFASRAPLPALGECWGASPIRHVRVPSHASCPLSVLALKILVQEG